MTNIIRTCAREGCEKTFIVPKNNTKKRICSKSCAAYYGNALRNQRELSIQKYNANPKICENCNEVIKLKNGIAPTKLKDQRFCSSRCAGKFNNRIRLSDPAKKSYKPAPICMRCNINKCHERQKSTYNKLCLECYIADREKLGNTLKKDKDRAQIGGHARMILTRACPDKICLLCKYEKHVECCHIRPICDFPGDTPISVINDVDNLRWLCPNCHWEFDHGIIPIERLMGAEAGDDPA